ncbi:hypothetical protein [Formosa sp. L2A11]|uniref:hypothetical protein n=1 Tax=Formosa sp. L2A11 TaxID=2686363 RepID=UPI00131D694F|nr:hypothetical protein [Formosa sp. L2A11]
MEYKLKKLASRIFISIIIFIIGWFIITIYIHETNDREFDIKFKYTYDQFMDMEEVYDSHWDEDTLELDFIVEDLAELNYIPYNELSKTLKTKKGRDSHIKTFMMSINVREAQKVGLSHVEGIYFFKNDDIEFSSIIDLDDFY